MYVSVSIYVCVCTMGEPGPGGGWERASDPLDLELQIVMSLHVGAGN